VSTIIGLAVGAGHEHHAAIFGLRLAIFEGHVGAVFAIVGDKVEENVCVDQRHASPRVNAMIASVLIPFPAWPRSLAKRLAGCFSSARTNTTLPSATRRKSTLLPGQHQINQRRQARVFSPVPEPAFHLAFRQRQPVEFLQSS
jgi:hypothetical protein